MQNRQNRIESVKPRLHQRNMLFEATCCAQQATCCPQHVARPRNLLPRNMLRWCKRGFIAATIGCTSMHLHSVFSGTCAAP